MGGVEVYLLRLILKRDIAMTEYQKIKDALPRGELLAQLAEECAELGKAALKLRRVITDGASPTPISLDDAEDAVHEEIADVILCLELAGGYVYSVTLNQDIEDIKERKIRRWAKRCAGLKELENDG